MSSNEKRSWKGMTLYEKGVRIFFYAVMAATAATFCLIVILWLYKDELIGAAPLSFPHPMMANQAIAETVPPEADPTPAGIPPHPSLTEEDWAEYRRQLAQPKPATCKTGFPFGLGGTICPIKPSRH